MKPFEHYYRVTFQFFNATSNPEEQVHGALSSDTVAAVSKSSIQK